MTALSRASLNPSETTLQYLSESIFSSNSGLHTRLTVLQSSPFISPHYRTDFWNIKLDVCVQVCVLDFPCKLARLRPLYQLSSEAAAAVVHARIDG